MKTVLCTLYNSFYLDKGLVMYDSLKEVSSGFILYVLCMDDKCYDVLTDIKADSMVPIKLEEFEDEELLEIKKTRSFGEYCWTLTPSLISYILKKYEEPICTYIDADMFFYQNPQVLIDEMLMVDKTVMITPHRFSPENEKQIVKGVYCVEFNTFVNENTSLNILEEWRKNCLNNCAVKNDGKHFGDQKYLDKWPKDYPSVVHVCQHPGAGVAPWNIAWYEKRDMVKHTVYYKKGRLDIPVVFFHFHHVKYITRDVINTSIDANASTIDFDLVNSFYFEYLMTIEKKKKFLESKYGIDYIMVEHPVVMQYKNWKTWLKKYRLIVRIHKYICPHKYPDEYIIKLERN